MEGEEKRGKKREELYSFHFDFGREAADFKE